MGFKRKRGASNRRKEGMPHGCGEKDRRIVVFSKSEASSRSLSGWRELLCVPPTPPRPSSILHPPSPPHTPAFLQTLSNALAQVKHNENSYPSPFPHREKKKKKKKTKKRERNYRLFMILLSRNEKTKKQQKEKQLLNIASSPSCSEAETRRDSSHACSLMNLMRLSVDVKIITRPFLPLRVI